MTVTILVVDDSPTQVSGISSLLGELGHRVEAAMNGRDALDRLESGFRPTLIMTDINMPVMDGITFIRMARSRAATRFTPILVLTSETDKEAEGREAGASGWLAKPLRREEVIAALRRLLPP